MDCNRTQAVSLVHGLTHHLLPPTAPPFTLETIVNHVKGVSNWKELGLCLDVPGSELNEIEQRSNSDECLRSMLQQWILRNPGASWRKLIWSLDASRHIKVADPIRSWAERVKGML